jgi:hypothetical protein
MSWDGAASLIGFNLDGSRLAVGTTDGIATYASADAAAGPVMRPAGIGAVSGAMLSADWSIAVGEEASPIGPPPKQFRWQTPDGPAQPISADVLDLGVLSSDGAVLMRTELFWHEFTGDYFRTIVHDVATGALVQQFYNHLVAPSADGKRMFGLAGAVFCR